MRCAGISYLSIHFYTVSLLTPMYLQISLIDNQQSSIPFEAPGASLIHDFEFMFIVAEDEPAVRAPGRILVDDLEGVASVPVSFYDLDQFIRQDPSDHGIRSEFFESSHY